MQASPSFTESRVVRVLRWVARALGVVAALGLALWVSMSLTPEAPGVPPMVIEPTMWARWGILGAGLVLAIVGSIAWRGLSEVIGGLLLVGGGLWQGFAYLPPQTGQLTAGAVFMVPGVLFIVCGWYALAHQHRHAPQALA